VVVLLSTVLIDARYPQCGEVIVVLSVTVPKSETPSESVTVTILTLEDSQGLMKPHMHISFLHSDFSSLSLSQYEPVGKGPHEFVDAETVVVET
jgi:hypothetical protein